MAFSTVIRKGKAIPLLTWTGPKGSRSFRVPDFETVYTWRCKGWKLSVLRTGPLTPLL